MLYDRSDDSLSTARSILRGGALHVFSSEIPKNDAIVRQLIKCDDRFWRGLVICTTKVASADTVRVILRVLVSGQKNLEIKREIFVWLCKVKVET
jgi:hypothetical protein